jgi:5-formyltetrahydrofolate cyclo-ligase
MPGVKEQKAALRSRLLAARAELTAEQRTAAGRAIRDALLERPEVQMAGTIAAYYSVGAEPDTRGLLFALWKRGSYVLLPLLRPDGDLDWASYEGPESLGCSSRASRRAAPARWPGPTWCWRPRWPWTGPGTGSAGAAAATTARWPGSGRWSR